MSGVQDELNRMEQTMAQDEHQEKELARKMAGMRPDVKKVEAKLAKDEMELKKLQGEVDKDKVALETEKHKAEELADLQHEDQALKAKIQGDRAAVQKASAAVQSSVDKK